MRRLLDAAGRVAIVLVALGALVAADIPGSQKVQGTQADNAALVGSPLLVGVAKADGAAPGALTAGNAAQLRTDVQGRALVRIGHPNFVSANASAVTATTQLLGLSGASLSYYITDVLLSCGATASTLSIVSSTTAGNACATSPVVVIPTVPLAINGALAMPGMQNPIKVTANSALCCKTSGATAVSCLVSGYIAP